MLSKKYRIVDNREDDKGNVWCYECQQYLRSDLFYKINNGRYWTSTCRNCSNIVVRRKTKIQSYPYGHWEIEETDELKEQMLELFKRLGYNTEENIHQQFMEKYKEYFINKK